MKDIEQLVKVMEWAIAEGVAEATRACHACLEPSFDFTMGLWQSFQTTFPKESFSDYDGAIYLASKAFKASCEASYKGCSYKRCKNQK